jgi:hypothetical protein
VRCWRPVGSTAGVTTTRDNWGTDRSGTTVRRQCRLPGSMTRLRSPPETMPPKRTTRARWLATGGIECWGSGYNGYLGTGNAFDSPTPIPVIGITNATAVAAANDHSCAVLATGGVDCWGDNVYGQPGNGTIISVSMSPARLSRIASATAIAAGYYHSCALLRTGGVDCWGNNGSGQVGNGIPSGQGGCDFFGVYSASCTPVPVPVRGIGP